MQKLHAFISLEGGGFIHSVFFFSFLVLRWGAQICFAFLCERVTALVTEAKTETESKSDSN